MNGFISIVPKKHFLLFCFVNITLRSLLDRLILSSGFLGPLDCMIMPINYSTQQSIFFSQFRHRGGHEQKTTPAGGRDFQSKFEFFVQVQRRRDSTKTVVHQILLLSYPSRFLFYVKFNYKDIVIDCVRGCAAICSALSAPINIY